MAPYADAFPIFLNYYPSSTLLRLPPLAASSPVAYASRAELAEASAALIMRRSSGDDSHDKGIVLLTGPVAVTLAELVQAINEASGKRVRIQEVGVEEFVRVSAVGDEGGKGREWFRKRLGWYEAVARGEAGTVDPLMGELLGRRPLDGREVVGGLVGRDPGYTWHQNYAVKRK